MLGMTNYRSGHQTPTNNNILERSLRSQNLSLEESKMSDNNASLMMLNQTLLSNKSHHTNNSIHNPRSGGGLIGLGLTNNFMP